jgi:hypothetical protein
MSNSLRIVLGYALAPGESVQSAAQRFGASPGAVKTIATGVVELPLTIDLGGASQPSASQRLESELKSRFADATRTPTTSGDVSSIRIETADETFDVVWRDDRVYVLTFDGFGGFAEVRGDALGKAIDAAHKAYAAVLAARQL